MRKTGKRVMTDHDVDDEDEGVVVLDLLHRGLRRQRVADDAVLVHLHNVRTVRQTWIDCPGG